MADVPQGGQMQWQAHGRPDNSEAKVSCQGQGLNVHARAASEKQNVINELQAQPEVTCFGLRRKSQSTAPRAVSWTGVTVPEKSSEQARAQKDLSEAKPATTCGAQDIFQSIGTNFLSDIFDSRSKSKEKTSRDNERVGAVPQLVETRVEEVVVTPKIMASYESISLSSQKHPHTGLEERPAQEEYHSPVDGIQDCDRDDGADSIVQEEEYDNFSMPQWTVDPHDIFFISRGDGSQKVCRLGKGEYGPVYLGVWQDQEVAVKLARQAPISLKNERQFQTNIARLHSLNHPNIVAFLGACCWKGGKRSVLVTEFMDKSDLRMLLGRPDLAPKFAWREHGQTVALDVAHGLGYLHAQGLVHGRLRSTNVLMNKAGVAKLSDVALSKLLSHCKTGGSDKALRTSATQEDYDMRLTVGAGEDDTMPGDILSFGMVLHELLTQERSVEGTLRAIRTPSEAPAKIAYLVECCLDSDPSQRPSIDRVISIIGGKK